MLYFYLFLLSKTNISFHYFYGVILRFFMLNKTVKFSVLAATISTLLTACGGGGGDSSSSTFKAKEISGLAVDFYIQDGLVSFSNTNCQTKEPITTDEHGNFSFTSSEACQNSAITITGGKDIATGLPFTGQLKIKNIDFQAPDRIVVSPLTTLENYLIETKQPEVLAQILKNLGITEVTTSNISNFDPAKDGSAHTAAAAFALQQLINQIEDNLETVNKNDGSPALNSNQSNQFAFQSVVSSLIEKPLFLGSTINIDTSILETIISTALDKAETAVNVNLPDAEKITINTQLVDQVKVAMVSLTTTLDSAIKNASSGDDLFTEISKDEHKDKLTETLAQPMYGSIKLAGIELLSVKQSTETDPILITHADLDQTIAIDFGIQNAKAALTDNFKIGFHVQIQGTGSRTETLSAILDNVQVNFDKTGTITSATILKDTLVTVESSLPFTSPTANLTVSYAQTGLPKTIYLSNNRTISLADILKSDSRLNDAYNHYKSYLKSESTLSSSAYILPTSYGIDPKLSLSTSTLTIKNTSFTAPSMTGHFKLK